MQALTDEQIETRFSVLMNEALKAFRSDPSYVVEMGEEAAHYRRTGKTLWRSANLLTLRQLRTQETTFTPARKPATRKLRIKNRNAEIARKRLAGVPAAELAQRYGIHKAHVWRIAKDAAEAQGVEVPTTRPDKSHRNQQIAEYRRKGRTLEELAERFGMTPTGIQHVLKREGVPSGPVRSRKWAERDERIKAMVAQGLRGNQIAHELNLSEASISRILKRLRES